MKINTEQPRERSEKKTIAVDFDGTVVTHEYPEIGSDVPYAVDVLKRLNRAGVRIIVWTLRCGQNPDEETVAWFEERGIKVWSYNCNPEQSTWSESPKCYAHAYVDDAAVGCPLIYPDNGRPYVDWKKVETLLQESGFLSSTV